MVRVPEPADERPGVDWATLRRILVHEARVHALAGRRLRDLGDSVLLHDPLDPEPFWNRLEAVRWPEEAAAFDRRLDEITVLFASLRAAATCRASPAFDRPGDLVERLLAAGFEDIGPGYLMLLVDPAVPRGIVAGPRAVSPMSRSFGGTG